MLSAKASIVNDIFHEELLQEKNMEIVSISTIDFLVKLD